MHRFHYVAFGAAVGAALALLAISPPSAPLISAATASPSKNSSTTYRELQLFGKVFDVVRRDYVEKPNSAKLIQSAIKGMINSLDPHSNYMDAQNYKEMQVDTKGEFGGLGMEVTTENNAIKVVSPIDDTPAAKAGILAGDIITKVDGKSVNALPLATERVEFPDANVTDIAALDAITHRTNLDHLARQDQHHGLGDVCALDAERHL